MAKTGNGNGNGHLKLALGIIGMVLTLIGGAMLWAHGEFKDQDVRVRVAEERGVRNEERLKNIEKNTAENNTMLRELLRGGKP